jgi:PAS domain S-box-containing protein
MSTHNKTAQDSFAGLPAPSDKTNHSNEYTPPYGNLTKLNTARTLIDGVGEENLADIAREYLDLLDSSGAIYEVNGDYANGIFASGWCQFMDSASRKLCKTDDNTAALNGGRWLCHESCWNEASKVSMETAQPTDIECQGGINLYAVPVIAGDKIVGAMNFGYGDPPTDKIKLNELAETFKVDVGELLNLANSYVSRPQHIIDVAKRRLKLSARLVGQIIHGKMAEHALRESEQRFRGAFETAAHGIALTSLDGKFFKINRSFCQIVGYSESEMLNIDFQSITHPEDLDTDLNLVEQILAGTVPTYQLEKRYIHKNGHVVWVLLSVALVKNSDNLPAYFVAQAHDITDKKMASDLLKKAKNDLELQAKCITRLKNRFIDEVDHDVLFEDLLLDALNSMTYRLKPVGCYWAKAH